MTERNLSLLRPVLYLLLLFLIFSGLYFAAGILVPLALAGMLAMLFLPLSRWLESKGMNRTVAAVCCIVLLLAVVVLFGSLIGWRISNLQADLDQVEAQAQNYLLQLQAFINERFGITEEQQEELIKQQSGSGGAGAASYLARFAAGFLGSLTSAILVLIYIFLFISSRRHFKNFILKLASSDQQAETLQIMEGTTGVAQRYVSGLAKMIGCLWVMYGIGFSIVGVHNAIFFAILCGTLEIVPFVGNITGTCITVLMALAQGGGAGMAVNVMITYGVVQFIQSYILQPLVVGKDVDLNPFFSIFVLVVGEAVWGVGGMVLAIPLLGMLKIIFDHVTPLRPYSYLIGSGEQKASGPTLFQKMRDWFVSRRK